MIKPPLCLLALMTALALPAWGAEPTAWEIESTRPDSVVDFNVRSGLVTATNGIRVRYGESVLAADTGVLNQETGAITAQGNVLLQRGDQLWRSDRLDYNFKTGELQGQAFRVGTPPYFAAGEQLTGNQTNRHYTASRAFMTSDDVAEPGYRVQGKSMTLVPGKYLEVRQATVYWGRTPVFYWPYYRRNLDRTANHFTVVPGYRSAFGPFVLGTYHHFWSEQLLTSLNVDYRLKRGGGAGPEVKYDFGRYGIGSLLYYYAHDLEPGTLVGTATPIDPDRHRVLFTHSAQLRPSLTTKTVINYQDDPQFIRDFFESEFQRNPQPKSFFELNQLWPNFSLNLLAQPQLVDFFETVERLPEVRLSALPQQVGVSPFYYEGENSLGYYQRSTNGLPEFSAWRADSFHQLLLPQTFFGWLNVVPRVGGRFTHYGETEGGLALEEQDRWVFNTGVETSFKASQTWRGARHEFWEVEGLRHIIEPGANYAFVPHPTRAPRELPQFDPVFPSLRPLPIEFPDFNAIDSIDSQNVVRWSVRNRLQTKRGSQIVNLVDWNVFTDWRLDPRPGQRTYADLYSDLELRPHSWLALQSEVRLDLNDGLLRESYHLINLQPGNEWSFGIGHRYLQEEPALGINTGNNLIFTSLAYRFNENWAARAIHRFEARDGTLEEQSYTLFRDLRSWTAAFILRIREDRVGPTDYTFAFSFSLKAFPRVSSGLDREFSARLIDG